MKKYSLKFLFFILKSIVFLKKAFFVLIKSFFSFFKGVDETYKRTLGFRIYKIIFAFQKKFFNIILNIKNQSKLEIFGSRTFLQFILLFLIFIVILPQTIFFKKNYSNDSGRKSILFKIIGPGSQDFTLEEISFDLSANIETKKTSESWKIGSVAFTGEKENNSFEENNSLAIGGTALKKPTYISSFDFSEYSKDILEKTATGRSEILVYEVLPGDVIGKIAEKFSIDINTILWANNLTINSYIRPGDKLIILPVSGIIHKVVSGDTISKIARLYDSASEDIINFNNLDESGTNIKIGQILLIPNGKKVQVVSNRPSSYNTVAATPASASVPAGTGYLWPTSASIITQYFGWRHGGLDIAGPVGTPLYASKSGKVLASACGWNWGYGCYVHLDHGNGIQTIYAHASVLYVSVGDYVTQGQTIAGMGSTGNSTGPHIHFEIRVNGVRQNPLAYIRK